MAWFMPREENFFELFERAAENANLAAGELLELLEKFDDVRARSKRIKDIEHAGDKITHDTIERLNRTFITPMDREDIHELICRLDDIADSVDTTAHRMVLYRIEKPTEDCKKLAACLHHATGVLVEAMPLLRDMKNTAKLRERVIAVHEQENQADQVLSHAIAGLFQNEPDAREIIKWKDVYQEIETATDRCEDVANILDAIMMKNA